MATGTVDHDGTVRDFAGVRTGTADRGGVVSDFGGVHIGRVVGIGSAPGHEPASPEQQPAPGGDLLDVDLAAGGASAPRLTPA